MVKETKFFRKQAKKAERMVRAISDAEAAESLSNLAEAYRQQADARASAAGDAPVPRDHRAHAVDNTRNSAR
jgi:hypothetical protein